MRKHRQHNNDERTRFFGKIYLSHFIRNCCERVMCERWVGDWIETTTYWPPVPLSFAALLYRSAGLLNRGPRRPCSLLRTATTDSKLTELPIAPGYIIVFRTHASCERRICTQFNPSTVKVIPWYLRPGAPFPWSTAGSEVNMLQWFRQLLCPVQQKRWYYLNYSYTISWLVYYTKYFYAISITLNIIRCQGFNRGECRIIIYHYYHVHSETEFTVHV